MKIFTRQMHDHVKSEIRFRKFSNKEEEKRERISTRRYYKRTMGHILFFLLFRNVQRVLRCTICPRERFDRSKLSISTEWKAIHSMPWKLISPYRSWNDDSSFVISCHFLGWALPFHSIKAFREILLLEKSRILFT